MSNKSAREQGQPKLQLDRGGAPRQALAELRERVSGLQSEVDRWKNQPWTLEHDYPNGQSAGGRRRGESAVDEMLDDLQVKVMLEHIGENTTGPIVAGSILLLIEYLGALAFAKRFNDLDMAIDQMRDGLLSGDYMDAYSAESLRQCAIQEVHRLVQFHVTSEIQNLTDSFQRYTEMRQRAQRID